MSRLLAPIVVLLFCAQIAIAQSTVFLVRHAEKAEIAADGGDPKNPELSDAGRARAGSLAKILRDAGLTAIYATEYKRTQQTAEPIAQAAGIKTTIVPAQETASLVAKLKESKGSALVVGHSNTVPEIIKGLAVSVPIAISDGDYDNLFILTAGERPQLIRLHF